VDIRNLDPRRLNSEAEAVALLERQQKTNEAVVVAQLAVQVAISSVPGGPVRESAEGLLRRIFDWGLGAAHGGVEEKA